MRRWAWALALFAPLRAFGWTVIASGLLGWKTPTLAVHVNPSNCPIPAATLNAIIDEAIQAWNGVPTSSLTLTRDPSPSATTVAQFTGKTATDAPVILCDPNFGADTQANVDGVPASTQVDVLSSGSDHIDYAGILLNAQSGAGAAIGSITTTQLTITLAHELGHVLGLGHSGRPEALMYYSINDKTQPVLTEDDMDGVSYLYPRNELSRGSFGCESVHSGSPASLGWALAVLLLQLGAGRAMRNLRPARPRALRAPPRGDGSRLPS